MKFRLATIVIAILAAYKHKHPNFEQETYR